MILALALAPLAISAALWVWAEFRGGVALRLASGAIFAGFLAYASYYIGWLGPQYTITYYEWAVKRSAAALESGQVEVVREAFKEYATQPKPYPITILARLEKAGFRE